MGKEIGGSGRLDCLLAMFHQGLEEVGVHGSMLH